MHAQHSSLLYLEMALFIAHIGDGDCMHHARSVKMSNRPFNLTIKMKVYLPPKHTRQVKNTELKMENFGVQPTVESEACFLKADAIFTVLLGASCIDFYVELLETNIIVYQTSKLLLDAKQALSE